MIPQTSGRAAAAEAQPADDEQLPEGVERIVQFVHPEKVYGYLAGLNEDLLAALYGLDVETYRELTGRYDANARDAARDLLADRSFARQLNRLR